MIRYTVNNAMPCTVREDELPWPPGKVPCTKDCTVKAGKRKTMKYLTGWEADTDAMTKEEAVDYILHKCENCSIQNDCSGASSNLCSAKVEALMKKYGMTLEEPPVAEDSTEKDTRPLADRLRPASADRIIGQKHLLGPGKPLTAYLQNGACASAVFYGPPGTGKTTAANIIAASCKKQFVKLNATTAGTDDIKKVFALADASEEGVLLYLDEIQYFNKKQQQTLLSHVESGKVQLIGATTENPYFCVYKALLSRSMVFEFKPVSDADVAYAVQRAIDDMCLRNKEFYGPLMMENRIPEAIARTSAGDVRKALTLLEMLIQAAPEEQGTKMLTLDGLAALGQSGNLRYDRGGDEMYDLASGLHKSLRGSEPDAALHYLARFLEAGDLLTPIRRLLCAASEDVGLAWSQCALIVKTLCDSALQVGLPEAQLMLAHAALVICNAPKSNSAHDAIHAAWEDVKKGAAYPLPRNLQNVHADTTGTAPSCAKKAQNYLYPHDYRNHYVEQPYLPEQLAGKRYYHFGDNPSEQQAKAYWESIKGKNLS